MARLELREDSQQTLKLYADAARLVRVSSPAQASYQYLHTDPLGTPLGVTDGSGRVVWRASYGPFGDLASITQDADGDDTPLQLNLRSPGQYFDAQDRPALQPSTALTTPAPAAIWKPIPWVNRPGFPGGSWV